MREGKPSFASSFGSAPILEVCESMAVDCDTTHIPGSFLRYRGYGCGESLLDILKATAGQQDLPAHTLDEAPDNPLILE
ncbi:MAG TPA: hypothetical protein V6D10_05565 [Trichocoleus sp.]